ncbi:transposase InsO family protein [Peptococcaceae bacterium DYL19]|nr:IS3 family transposase [Phosphitispora fastidiosa]MBU7008544.1 transposase InsO family protein [Phosphitispora fastidiosa]
MKPQKLHKLLQDLEQELLRLGYTKGSMTFYRNRWRKLKDFADKKGQEYYTEQLGIDFVQEYFGITQDDFSRTLNQAQTQELRVILMVGDFQLHHAVLRRYLKHRKLLTNPYFIETSKRFEDYCVSTKDYSKSTVVHYTKQSGYFMDYLLAQGMHDFSCISMDNNTYGSIKVRKSLEAKDAEERYCKLQRINHKRIERIMRRNGIKSKVKKKYKATTDSNHNLPVAENLLNRDFGTEKPNKKLVSDITYVHTDEGWLYVAAIMDLCGGKIVGLSMSDRMTKQLVIDALHDAYKTSGRPQKAILHSDRGSQYCSYAYREQLTKYGYICSMSRKGNCWDNAPMESFWGKMKQEWLNDQKFRTRAEAKSKIFEYIMIFYNRKRLHASYDYRTPEAYYREKLLLHCAA